MSGQVASEGEVRPKRGWLRPVRLSPLSDVEASEQARTPAAGPFAPPLAVLSANCACRGMMRKRIAVDKSVVGTKDVLILNC